MATTKIEIFSVTRAAILDGTTGAEESVGKMEGVRSASLSASLSKYKNTGDDAIKSVWYWLEEATLTIEAGYISMELQALLSGSTITTSGAATKAVAKFTPAATGTDVFDYAGAAAIAFTINDGTGATTVTLDADYTNLAGVVAAVDADLGAGYVVTADTTLVKIEAATAGLKTFYIGGTDAADITGSAGYTNTIGTAGNTNSLPLWEKDSVNQAARPVLVTCDSRDSDGNPREFDFVLFKVQFAPIVFQGPKYKDGLLVNYNGEPLMSSVDEAGDALAKEAYGRLVDRPVS